MFTRTLEFTPFFQRMFSSLFSLIWLGMLSISCQSPSAESSVAAVSPDTATENSLPSFSFENVTGEGISFAPTTNQWTVLHFWATWCKPCLAEFPELKNALPRLDTDSVQFLLASDEDLDRIIAFQKKYETGLELIRMKTGTMADFEIYALPTTIVLDKDGKEVYRHAGQLKWADISSIDQLVAEQP